MDSEIETALSDSETETALSDCETVDSETETSPSGRLGQYHYDGAEQHRHP